MPPTSKMTGKVPILVPQCTCPLLRNHRGDDMSVYTVPDTRARWACAAVGVLPVLSLTIIIASQNTPTAVLAGEVNETWYYVGIMLLTWVVPLVLMCWVACMRMHDKQEYILGGVKYMSVTLGLLSIFRMISELFS